MWFCAIKHRAENSVKSVFALLLQAYRASREQNIKGQHEFFDF